MVHFADLSDYTYHEEVARQSVPKNIGWLGAGIAFETAVPAAGFLDLLWQHCLVSINQTRGLYACHLCGSLDANVSQRDGQQLVLGSAEIRVLARDGQVYAAPNLIYHYVSVHHYSPPQEFREAVNGGLRPSSQEYIDRLTELGLEFRPTSTPAPNRPRFKFVKTPEGVQRVEE